MGRILRALTRREINATAIGHITRLLAKLILMPITMPRRDASRGGIVRVEGGCGVYTTGIPTRYASRQPRLRVVEVSFDRSERSFIIRLLSGTLLIDRSAPLHFSKKLSLRLPAAKKIESRPSQRVEGTSF